MTDQVRVGVIGAGTLGTRHCRTLVERAPNANLVAVADTNEDAAKRASLLSPGATATTAYQDLLDDPSLDAVLIVVPNDQHAQLITEAAEAKKHVFCEKPIALSLDDADAAVEAVARNGVKLQIGFQRRFDAAYREAQRAIAAGELGAIELVFGTTKDPAPPSREYLDHSGSIFADLAVHDFDSLRYLTGLEVSEVYATASTLIDDSADAPVHTAITTLRMDNGALVTITSTRRSNFGYDVRFELSGSLGMLTVGDARPSAVKTYSESVVAHDFVANYWGLFEDAYIAELQHFIDCVANDTEPGVTGADGRAALQIALLAEQSAREGQPLAVE